MTDKDPNVLPASALKLQVADMCPHTREYLSKAFEVVIESGIRTCDPSLPCLDVLVWTTAGSVWVALVDFSDTVPQGTAQSAILSPGSLKTPDEGLKIADFLLSCIKHRRACGVTDTFEENALAGRRAVYLMSEGLMSGFQIVAPPPANADVSLN